MSMITIEKNDITKSTTECIVNAANSYLAYGGGVCGAIFRAAGVFELTEACEAIGYCNTGNAVITPAFKMANQKYIIHAVGPEYSPSCADKCKAFLIGAYKRSLELMLENGCHSITFPLISAGIYGYPHDEAWNIAISTCKEFISMHENENIDIRFAVLSDEMLDMGNKELAK